MEACLEVVVERGDELALHGYSHLDTARAAAACAERFLRNVYTQPRGRVRRPRRSRGEAPPRPGHGLVRRTRLEAGRLHPAGLAAGQGRLARAARFGFAYTTTFSRFHCLEGEGRAVLSPSLVYTARNRGGRLLSPRVADATAAMLANAPLVRFSLHPPDARYPELVRHTQRMLERLLAQREAVTKAECARRLMQPQPGMQSDAGKIVLPLVDTADTEADDKAADGHAVHEDSAGTVAAAVPPADALPEPEAAATEAAPVPASMQDTVDAAQAPVTDFRSPHPCRPSQVRWRRVRLYQRGPHTAPAAVP
jgi:hypothetical protein